MPQMFPMNWIMLYFFFISVLTIINLKIFFFTIINVPYNKKKIIFYHNYHNNYNNWKW
uniref:ATP synthase F0 subunit 8 n=1 Tax=Augomonoctenus smithi TaxID=1519147 RepID=UPI0023F15B8D|nr:ATP synthase F0 subunit 8 [Augomonoctenus smithi]WDY84670.1 ATP synthase F0 subunit 8 [Augomonoctenus smithi]